MKSNKQKKAEIRKKRLQRAEKLETALRNECLTGAMYRQPGLVLANAAQLEHFSEFEPLPEYYIDKAFVCVDCGVDQVWTAKQQKWWYEIAKGACGSTAIRCRGCRKRERERKQEARRVHLEGLERKKLRQMDK